MRCFVSIDIGKDIEEEIIGLQREIKNTGANVKMVEPFNLHFTVKFIGDVNEIGLIKKKIETAISHRPPFTLELSGLSYFGHSSRIRTLWIGVNEGREKLEEMMKSLGEEISRGDGRVSPHITIGRVKSDRCKEKLIEFINSKKYVKIGKMDVKEVKLKSSVLTRDGPVYDDLFTFTLAG